jgi:hypothetical protein
MTRQEELLCQIRKLKGELEVFESQLTPYTKTIKNNQLLICEQNINRELAVYNKILKELKTDIGLE